MAIKRNKRFHAEVATSSLRDIMFFLLLFFLIISTLANPNVIRMTLPKSKTNEKTNKQLITLSVTEEKRFFCRQRRSCFRKIGRNFTFKNGCFKRSNSCDSNSFQYASARFSRCATNRRKEQTQIRHRYKSEVDYFKFRMSHNIQN